MSRSRAYVHRTYTETRRGSAVLSANPLSWLTWLWLRGLDLNQRPLGYEPNELPDCSTPRHLPLEI